MLREIIDLVGDLSQVKRGMVEGLIWSVCVAGIYFGVVALAPIH